MENIVKSFEKVTPKPTVVGGAIEIYGDRKLPGWLTDSCRASLGFLNYGNTPKFLRNRYLFGGNLAFDASVFNTIQFNENLGRKGKIMLTYEETFLQKELQSHNKKIYYSPEIKIKHYVPKKRMTYWWHIKRHFWQGVSISVVKFFLGKKCFSFISECVSIIVSISYEFKNIVINRECFNHNLFNLIIKIGLFCGLISALFWSNNHD